MTNFLLRLFVKDCQNTQDPAVHSAIGKLAGTTGILCNAVLFVGKLTAGLLVGSVSIVADAVNNLTDAASSVVTLLGFHLARRPADEDHPYGHARYEYLSGLAVAVLILLLGAELAKSSVEKILHPVPVEFSALTALILLGSIAMKLWMSGFFASLGKRIHSTTLMAAAADSRNDVIATSAVLAGSLAGHFFQINADGWLGLGVALFILYSGCNVAKETVSPLLGKQADGALVEALTRQVLSNEKILGIHDLLIHDYGPGQCFASVHAELDAREDPLACHEIIDGIERTVLDQMNVHLVIHYDPVTVSDGEWKEMHSLLEEIIHSIDPQLSMHDLRMVRSTRQPRLVFDLAIPYSMSVRCDALKAQIDSALLQAGKHYTTDIHFDGKA